MDTTQSSPPATDEVAQFLAGVEERVVEAQEAARQAALLQEAAQRVRGVGRAPGVVVEVDAGARVQAITFGTPTTGEPSLLTRRVADAVRQAHEDAVAQVIAHATALWGASSPRTTDLAAELRRLHGVAA